LERAVANKRRRTASKKQSKGSKNQKGTAPAGELRDIPSGSELEPFLVSFLSKELDLPSERVRDVLRLTIRRLFDCLSRSSETTGERVRMPLAESVDIGWLAAVHGTLRNKVENWIFRYLRDEFPPEDIKPNTNFTKDLHINDNVLPVLAGAYTYSIRHEAQWQSAHINPRKFALDPQDLNGAVKSKAVTDLVTYLYKKTKAAVS
jgi:hypothetical protein